MSIIDRLLGWVYKWSARKLRARMASRGERMFAGSVPGGRYGFWSQDRWEQVRHYRGWVYAGVQARATEMSRHEPHIDYVDQRNPADRIARVNAHTLHARVKGITKPKPHEELRPAEEDHPLVQLFRTPNPYDTLADLYFEHTLFKVLTGSAYWWAPRNLAGLPSELWVLPSHWIFPQLGKDRLVEGYWFSPYGAGAAGGWGTLLPPEEVIHFKDKHPLHKIDGYASLTAGAEIIDVSEAVNTSRWSHFERGIEPGLHIELGEGVDLDDEDMDRYYAKILNRFQGRDKHGLPIVTQHGGKVSRITMTPEEMGYVHSAEQLATFVLAILRVPKELTGMQPIGSDLSWYAPLRFFTRFVISPELRALDAGHTKRLGELYDPPLRVWHDDPTPDDPKQVNEDVSTDFRVGARTPNEIRSLRGLEAYEGYGDRPLVPSSLQPAHFEGDPEPMQAPLEGAGVAGNGRLPPGAGAPGNGRNPRLAAGLAPAAIARRLKSTDAAGHEHKPAGEGGGQFTSQGGGGGNGKEEPPDEEEDDEKDVDTEEDEAMAAWQEYDADHAAWEEETAQIQADHDKARAEYDREYARWEEDTTRLTERHEEDKEKFEEAHGEWTDRNARRQEQRNAIDESDPVGMSSTSEAFKAPTPEWDLNQSDSVAHYRSQVEAFAADRGRAWEAGFGKDGSARAAFVSLGATGNDLASFDKLARKGGVAIAKQAEKYKATAGKYLDYQERLDAEEAKYNALEEPVEPEQPDLDDPGEFDGEKPYLPDIASTQGLPPERPEYDSDEEYRAAVDEYKQGIDEAYAQAKAAYEQERADYQAEKKTYDDAWSAYDKDYAQWEKDSAAYEKLGSKVEAMGERAEELSGKMDEEAEALETTWTESVEPLGEEQDAIKETLLERIDEEEAEDEEPEEPEEPDLPDEPEALDEPEFPDEPDEPDLERPKKKEPDPAVNGKEDEQ